MVKKHHKTKQNKQLPTSMVIGALAIVVVIIVATFFFNNQEESIDYSSYNAFEFSKVDTGWQTVVERDGQAFEVPFYNHPLDITNVMYNDNVTSLFIDVINTQKPQRQFIIALPSSQGSNQVHAGLAGINIARITGKFYGTQTKTALYSSSNITNQTFPTVTCDDANFQNIVVHINANATANTVSFIDDYCVQVLGTNRSGVQKSSDLLGYKLLGIMR